MKLKCDKHDRRVLTTPRGFEHRTDDRSPCDSESATIGRRSYVIDQGIMYLAYVDHEPVIDLARVPEDAYRR